MSRLESSRSQDHGASRRTVLRTVAWGAPVVLATVAAPAFAASPGPLTITASKAPNQHGSPNRVRLTFSGTGTVTLLSVSRDGDRIAMVPKVPAKLGIPPAATADGAKSSYKKRASYLVNYKYNNVPGTKSVIAT